MSSSQAASPQAGVFGGLNPATYNPSDPIVLFIIQVYLRDINIDNLNTKLKQSLFFYRLQSFLSFVGS